MKIKSIEFVFENTESIIIDSNNIGLFEISGIKENIGRSAMNYISSDKSFNHLAIQILEDAPYISCFEEYESMFERFKFNDITAVEVYYDNIEATESNKKSDTYYVENYKEDDCNSIGASNLNQKFLIKNGAMYIVISEDKVIYDIFEKEEIDNIENVEFARKMYS